MAICNKCGVQMNDDAKFCRECGSTNETLSIIQPEPQQLTKQNITENMDSKNQESASISELVPVQPKKKSAKRNMIIVACVVALAVLFLSISGSDFARGFIDGILGKNPSVDADHAEMSTSTIESTEQSPTTTDMVDLYNDFQHIKNNGKAINGVTQLLYIFDSNGFTENANRFGNILDYSKWESCPDSEWFYDYVYPLYKGNELVAEIYIEVEKDKEANLGNIHTIKVSFQAKYASDGIITFLPAIYGCDPTLTEDKSSQLAAEIISGKSGFVFNGSEFAIETKQDNSYELRIRPVPDEYISMFDIEVIDVLKPVEEQRVEDASSTAKDEASSAQYRGYIHGRVEGPVNVRAGASTTADVIGSVVALDEFTVLDYDSTGWYFVKLPNGTEGYIKSDYVVLISTSGDGNMPLEWER